MACSAADLDELEQLKADLADVRAAITQVLKSGQAYMLNTSQSTQQVTRANLRFLQTYRLELRSEIRVLEARCGNGRTTIRGIPGW